VAQNGLFRVARRHFSLAEVALAAGVPNRLAMPKINNVGNSIVIRKQFSLHRSPFAELEVKGYNLW
jgi:hypothetical protein